MFVRLYDILWDTDDQDPKECGLPADVVMVMDEDTNIEEDGCDFLTDEYGFCVDGCAYTVLNNPRLSINGYELLDGGVLEYPNTEGEIVRRDQFGNTEEASLDDY